MSGPGKPTAGRPNAEGMLSAERVAQLLAAAQRRPELASLEWEGDSPRAAAPGPPPGSSEHEIPGDPATFDPLRRRIRDRYIGVRFAGVARSGADLQDPRRVIKAARLAFEEERPDSALELLDLAIEQQAREATLRLAKLEILFLLRACARYVETARAFLDACPGHAQWPEIMRVGHALEPGEPLFGAAPGARDDHYGPWPDTPNWIQAPWDLTAEVSAADFHRAMTAERPILLA